MTTRRQFLLGASAVGAAAAGLRPAGRYAPAAITTASWNSDLLTTNPGGSLAYGVDSLGHRLPDFGYVGYRRGQAPIPDPPIKKTICPTSGDNTAHIQAAIDEVGNLPADVTGIRGTVLLAPGEYPVAGTVHLNRSGVVLRGAGSGNDPAEDSILIATGNTPADRPVIVLGLGSLPDPMWEAEVSGTRRALSPGVVPVGSRQADVVDTSPYAVGDSVVISHPHTVEWSDAIGGGGTEGRIDGSSPTDAPPWSIGAYPILYSRHITNIVGSVITFDAPVYYNLDSSLSPCELYVWDDPGIVHDSGIESLRVDIQFAGSADADEDHARTAVRTVGAEDVWVSGCALLGFSFAGVEVSQSNRVTVSSCQAVEPASVITGGRRYNFCAGFKAQNVLFADCHAQGGRHSFVGNGFATTSGVVFANCTAEHAYAASEAHMRWNQGLLYDNHVEVDPQTNMVILLGNRGAWGSGHGWSAVNSVAWNCDLGGKRVVLHRPPTAQNFAIGCAGDVNTTTGWGFPERPLGYVEGTNAPGLVPASLYAAQLADATS